MKAQPCLRPTKHTLHALPVYFGLSGCCFARLPIFLSQLGLFKDAFGVKLVIHPCSLPVVKSCSFRRKEMGG